MAKKKRKLISISKRTENVFKRFGSSGFDFGSVCNIVCMHWSAGDLPWIQKLWCQPSGHAGRIISKERTHRFGASHLSDGRWIPMHKVHGIFHRQFRISFQDFRFSRLRTHTHTRVDSKNVVHGNVWAYRLPECASIYTDEWIYYRIVWIYHEHCNCQFCQQCPPCRPSNGQSTEHKSNPNTRIDDERMK